MKIRRIGISIAICLLASAIQSFAIEGLKLSLQCSNVVLSWPSVDGEIYIVQYRPTLDVATPWQTLTSSLPADVGTNLTFFVHSNIVQNPNCGGSVAEGSGDEGGDGPPAPGATLRASIDSGAPTFPQLPPLPWDTNTWVTSLQSTYSAGLNGANFDEGPDGPSGGPTGIALPETGFYQVVRDGVHIVGLTNLTGRTLSGTISLLFEVGNAVGELQGVNMRIDGTRCAGADSLVAPPVYPWNFLLDTAYLENGDHYVQIEANWLNPDTSDANNFAIPRSSDQFSLTVSNEINYPDWEELVGEGVSAYFAQTVYTGADWEIDISDNTGTRIKTLTGQATNGLIEAYWDLIDENGVARTNADSDPFFNSTIFVSAPNSLTSVQKKTPPKKQIKSAYPEPGKWTVAYQETFSYMVNSNMYRQAIDYFLYDGAQFGGGTVFFVLPGTSTNGQTYPLRFPNTNRVVNPPVTIVEILKDQKVLRAALTNTLSRNFYYNGHGLPDSFAGFLSSGELKQYIRHRYRFVFLDACLTANGGLPAAFGLNYNKPMSLGRFQQSGLRPGTFVGYSVKTDYCFLGPYIDPNTGQAMDGKVPEEVPNFLTDFEFYWYFGYGIGDALGEASLYKHVPGFQHSPGDGLELYGYDNLGIDSYNHPGDWP
jgi:hypothetical protein